MFMTENISRCMIKEIQMTQYLQIFHKWRDTPLGRWITHMLIVRLTKTYSISKTGSLSDKWRMGFWTLKGAYKWHVNLVSKVRCQLFYHCGNLLLLMDLVHKLQTLPPCLILFKQNFIVLIMTIILLERHPQLD